VLKLAGRTAVVTGAAGGIGRGIALALVRRGCNVALADIDVAALARTATEIAGQESARSPRVSHYRLDVANRAAVATLPAQVMAAHGAIDIP
jgi:NAD(P)-dependent dehydrogenase (short-subunit alcohol dehydrogenase family)